MHNFWLDKNQKDTDPSMTFKRKYRWDFQTALGDANCEKYESIYVKVVEIENVVHRKPLPKFKGKFQEASTENRSGRCYPQWVSEELQRGYDYHPENYEEETSGWDVDL